MFGRARSKTSVENAIAVVGVKTALLIGNILCIFQNSYFGIKNIFLISGLLSSGASVDTEDSEELTTASDTDTTMSDTRDPVDVTDMSYDISEGSPETPLSMPEAQKSKHRKPYLEFVEHNPAPEMAKKYPFEQLINMKHPIPLKSNIMDKPPNQLTNPSPRRFSVSRGTSPITAISTIPTVDLKNNNKTPFSAPQYAHYYIKRAKLVRQKPHIEESCSSRSESPSSSTPSPSSTLSPSSTDTISLDSMEIKPKKMRCIVTNL